jgi:hypothetical protein
MDRGQIASGETLAEVMALSTRAGEPNFSSNAGVFDVFGCSGLPLQQPERCPEVGIWEDWKIVAGNRMLPDTGLLETEGSASRSCPKSSSPLAMQIPESARSPEGCLGCPKIGDYGPPSRYKEENPLTFWVVTAVSMRIAEMRGVIAAKTNA